MKIKKQHFLWVSNLREYIPITPKDIKFLIRNLEIDQKLHYHEINQSEFTNNVFHTIELIT